MKRLLALIAVPLMLFSSAVFARSEYNATRDYVYTVNVDYYLQIVQEMDGEQLPIIVPSNTNGSAVVIAPGYAVSSWHIFEIADKTPTVMKSMTKLSIAPKGNQDNKVSVKIIAKNEKDDLVLLQGAFDCPCAPLALHEPEQDEEVLTVGYPGFDDYGIQFLTRGHYQGVSKQDLYAVTTNSAPGGSGGGAFQKQQGKYRLIGIVESISAVSVGPYRLGLRQERGWMTFLTPAERIRALIKGTPAEFTVQ